MVGPRCAICGDSIEPTLSLTLPPDCIELMKNGTDVDISRIDGDVIIHICDDDTAIIERLVESGQSPLSRCDADYAEFTTRERWKDAVGELLIPEYRDEKQQWEAIEDRRDFAVTTIIIAALIKDEPEVLDPVPDDKILEARVIYLSLAELGKISDHLLMQYRIQKSRSRATQHHLTEPGVLVSSANALSRGKS